MARRLRNRLIASGVNRLGPGMHADGAGLYLRVAASGSRSWIFRYRRDREEGEVSGRRREAGLGPYPEVGLGQARELALTARRQRVAGDDPLEVKKQKKQAVKIAAAKRMTFREVAENYIATNSSSWKNAQHIWQWSSSLRQHVYPVIGDIDIGAIDTPLIRSVLDPIWQEIPESASRIRSRIERILDAARASGLREGLNPAVWEGTP